MSHKILVVGPSWVGDMVMAQTLFMVLKRYHPQAMIDVLAPDWSRPLLERMPQVHQAIGFPFGHGQLRLCARYHFAKQLRSSQYQQAIVLPNSLKSALVPFWAKIPKRTGWLGEQRWGLLNDARRLDKAAYPLMIQRFIALARPKGASLPEPLPQPQLYVRPQAKVAVRETFQLTTDAPVLALCPGAEFGEAKRWPSEHYAAVARQMLDQGWQVWLFGSAKDQAVAAEIQSLTQQRCQDLTGRTQLSEAIDLLASARAVVSNDSGLMHIAAALGRPLVAVYGSSSPDFTPPLTDKAHLLRLGLACSPCFKRSCPLQHLDCLTKLVPEQVLAALSELTHAPTAG